MPSTSATAVLFERKASLSTTVTVTAVLPKVALLALLRLTVKLSCASASVSFVIGIEKVPEVCPAVMVCVRDVLVKSPDVAVPLVCT